ncbi:hypothetical protein E2C01_062872 [Portunus trituberculatus]|uniref:Uncharacterized protein n=1 Tax=Portunus trituberculatus TaxID=210409 RepID=A0A5B7HIR7_PORTR|nr:hypothetical protein [Portunus trituberculatus]
MRLSLVRGTQGRVGKEGRQQRVKGQDRRAPGRRQEGTEEREEEGEGAGWKKRKREEKEGIG